jgi:hypothetical protein
MIMGSRGDDDDRSLSGRSELRGIEVKGPTLQIAEVGAVTTGAGCHWHLHALPHPAVLFLHFQWFEGEGAPCIVPGGIALGDS